MNLAREVRPATVQLEYEIYATVVRPAVDRLEYCYIAGIINKSHYISLCLCKRIPLYQKEQIKVNNLGEHVYNSCVIKFSHLLQTFFYVITKEEDKWAKTTYALSVGSHVKWHCMPL